MIGHGIKVLLPDRPRPSRPSQRSPDGGRDGPAPGATRRAAAPAEDGCGAAILLRDAKAREGPAENSRPSAIAGPSRLPSDRPLEGRGRASPALGRRATELSTLMGAKGRLYDGRPQELKAGDVLRCQLDP